MWPEEKRKALAEAAVKALNIDPSNRDKGITAQAIHDLLEQNPSYIDLCKLLESKGLKFHRGQFARHLLTNVPDLGTTSGKPAEPPVKPIRGDIPQSMPRPALEQTIPVPPMASGPGGPPVHLNGGYAGPVKAEATAPTARFVPQQTYNPKSESTPLPKVLKPHLDVPSPKVSSPPPGSKAAMARKRDFSELVDLTQLSDDEDYVMPSKQPRLEELSPEPEVFRIETDIQASADQPYGTHFAPVDHTTQSLQFNPTQPRPALAPAPQPAQRPRTILARPINKSEALRKSYYDPKTVARDILIAAGRHPLERPLNAHLAGLLQPTY